MISIEKDNKNAWRHFYYPFLNITPFAHAILPPLEHLVKSCLEFP